MRTTRLTTIQIPKQENWYLLFGNPEQKNVHHADGFGACLRSFHFSPGQVFGVAFQKLNSRGITRWDSYILRATHLGEIAHKVHPAIEPAAECLISFHGKSKSLLAKEYLHLLKTHQLEASACTELHRLAAAYLAVGVLPTQLVQEFCSKRGLGSSHAR